MGPKSNVTNYRGISLLCTISKIFTKVLNNRLVRWAEHNDKLDDSQGAYRKGRSTVDHMFSLYSIIQKYLRKRGGRFYVAFIDFSRAFDSIPHSTLWYRLLQDGIHGRIITVFRSMYAKLRSCVKSSSGFTDFFSCTIGTRQGCMVSPLLFALYINELVNMCRRLLCPGIYVDEELSDFQLLMYADDICMINDSVGRLQTQLNVLSVFCKQYGLSVNLSKTKIVVFRNGGPLRRCERFYFDGAQLQSVSHYKYLGIIFSSRLCWSVPLQTLAAQADKAVYALKKLNKTVGGLPVSLSLDLFDKLVVPILMYGSELWGTEYRCHIERVQTKFCKYLFSLSYSTSNAAVLGDLGRTPLAVLYKYKCVKFWITIVHDENIRIRNSLYHNLKLIDDGGGHTWASEIKLLLYSLGFGHVWQEQGVGNIDVFLYVLKQRLLDTAHQNWHSDITNNCKLIMYRQYKITLEVEQYISIDMHWKYRAALARFRCVNHKLAVELYRAQRYDRNTRLCKYCTNKIEDEFHVLLECPLYLELRNRYIVPYCTHYSQSFYTFVKIMSSKNHTCIRNLALFTFHMFKIHQNYNSVI